MEKPSEMVKRVGERLRNECLDVFGATWSYDVAWRFANAAIEEMRTPNDEMLDKMNDVWVDAGEASINVCFADLKELFAVGIDAALKENEGKV
jgi:hypothetical protein